MRAIICGAGIAGLTLAWWLERDGWEVELVEKAPARRDAGYMIDFAGSGYDVAERMGLLPRLRAIQTSITRVHYLDRRGRGRGWFDYQGFTAALGGRACTVMRGELERVLHDALDGRVSVRYAATIDAITQHAGRPTVTLSDGSTAPVDLVVGADGIHSRVRALAFGPERLVQRYLGFHTASYLFEDEAMRAQVGDRFLIVAEPDRQVGLYPIDDGRIAAWLTHRTPDPRLPADPRAALQDNYGGLGDLVDRALTHVRGVPDVYYDRVAQIEMDGWARGGVTLAGDSCQAVSLLAGQGASLAMGGAYVLADELRRGDPERAAARYEQRMRPFVRDKQRSGRATARWLVPDTRWRIAARSLAFGATRMPGGTKVVGIALARAVSSVVPAGTEPAAVGR